MDEGGRDTQADLTVSVFLRDGFVRELAGIERHLLSVIGEAISRLRGAG